jgi:putative transposase
MSRPLCIEVSGGLYQVTSRGDRREVSGLGQVCQRFNWVCYAYCLIDSHFHIVAESVEGNSDIATDSVPCASCWAPAIR